jgi:hypothetical protein
LEEINLAFGQSVVIRMDEITDSEAHKEVGGYGDAESGNGKAVANNVNVEVP